jgi:hypothetical protein
MNYFRDMGDKEEVDSEMAGMSGNGFGGIAARFELPVQFQRFCCGR